MLRKSNFLYFKALEKGLAFLSAGEGFGAAFFILT